MSWKKQYFDNVQRVRRWTAKLEDAYLSGSWSQPRVGSGYLGSLVIELDNLIVDSLRTYAISLTRRHQALGNSIRRIGSRCISPDEFNSLILEMRQPQAYRGRGNPISVPRRDCPNIRLPQEMHQVLTKVGVGGLVDLQNAIALNFAVFGELRHARHYYAHRNFDTLDVLRRNSAPMASGVAATPEEYIHYPNPKTSDPKFIEWADEVRTFFDVATQ
jgi:hypothetical protein